MRKQESCKFCPYVGRWSFGSYYCNHKLKMVKEKVYVTKCIPDSCPLKGKLLRHICLDCVKRDALIKAQDFLINWLEMRVSDLESFNDYNELRSKIATLKAEIK